MGVDWMAEVVGRHHHCGRIAGRQRHLWLSKTFARREELK